jgi:ATP-binding cassette subfamily C exporter for protease/lipase
MIRAMKKIIWPWSLLREDNELILGLKAHKKSYLSLLCFSAIVNILMLTPSIYMLEVYDRVLISGNQYTLLMVSVIAIFLFLMLSLLERYKSMCAIYIGEQLDQQLSSRIYQAAFNNNLRQGNQLSGKHLEDFTIFRQFFTSQGVFAFMDLPWFPIYLAVIFLFDFWLGLFALISVALLIALTWLNEKVSSEPLLKAGALADQSSKIISAQLKNVDAIHAMGMITNIQNRWKKIHGEFIQHQSIASERASRISTYSKFLRLTVQSLILGVAALLVLQNEISAGMMIAASILLGRTLAPLELIINTWKQWKQTQASYLRLKQLLEKNPHQEIALELPRPKGQLSVENVYAQAPGSSTQILKGIHFDLPAGSILGIIGPSAAGKSTLAKLLVGIWPSTHGKVRLDGADMYTWDKKLLGPSLGYMPQSVELLEGTIAENIARFSELDSQKILEAAELAHIHQLILRFPKGYETEIGQDGSFLSAGQRQRIGLARAIYDKPSLVVLDEPNSNLDEIGEAALGKALIALKNQGATVVVISHRNHVIQLTDYLLILQDGQQKAFGKTSEVLKALQDKKNVSTS